MFDKFHSEGGAFFDTVEKVTEVEQRVTTCPRSLGQDHSEDKCRLWQLPAEGYNSCGLQVNLVVDKNKPIPAKHWRGLVFLGL